MVPSRTLGRLSRMRRHFPISRGRWPTLWLLSDENHPDWEKALDALPAGSGVVFRHYRARHRRDYAGRIAARARRRRLHLHVAVREDGDPLPVPAFACRGLHVGGRALRFPARCRWGAARRRRRCRLSVAVHNEDEWRRARMFRADCIFLSPIFPTASHPGRAGRRRILLLTLRRLRPRRGERVVALGGIRPDTARGLPPGRFHALGAVRGLIPADPGKA